MGKTQVASNDPSKPSARWVGSKVKNPEDAQEIAELVADTERARQRNEAKANKVTKFLNDNFYRTDKTWPWLVWDVTKQQMMVRFFFPNKNLAIDQFPNPTDWDRKQAAAKAVLFAKHKIKYFPMFPENKLLELSEYL